MSDTLHIVCLDAPSPPDYGGAIDMFYKIRSLAQIGKKIILHYFAYQPHRGTGGLEAYCTAVYAYERKSFFSSLSLSSPFIVESRISKQLVDRLNNDRHPILLEGLHCSGIIPLIEKNERVILRMHNEEAAYYKHLAATEKAFLKKLYYKTESWLIDRFQHNLDKSVLLACLSETDMDIFSNHYQFRKLFFLPCFLPWQQVNCLTGKGEYCLYHGNLSVA
ncbi:MAG: mannosyltransferase, partial [Chitinophagaceae bacterium]